MITVVLHSESSLLDDTLKLLRVLTVGREAFTDPLSPCVEGTEREFRISSNLRRNVGNLDIILAIPCSLIAKDTHFNTNKKSTNLKR